MNSKYHWVEKFNTGEYISEWNGFYPFYAGCFVGYSLCLGGEEKFRHCYGFFSGIGDVEWWDKTEIDKLTEEERKELLFILKRNKTFHENKGVLAGPLASVLGVEPYQIHRLTSLEFKGILDLIDSKSNKYKQNYPVIENHLPTEEIDKSDKDFYTSLITELQEVSL